MGIEKPIIEAAHSLDETSDLYALPVGAYIANMEDTDGATTHWVTILAENDRSLLCETATNWRGGANDDMAHVLSPELMKALQFKRVHKIIPVSWSPSPVLDVPDVADVVVVNEQGAVQPVRELNDREKRFVNSHVVQNVSGDGNCLFASIALATGRDPVDEQHEKSAPVRADCVVYMREHWDDIPKSLLRMCPQFASDVHAARPELKLETLLMDLEHTAANAAEIHRWGGNACLWALAQAYHCDVVGFRRRAVACGVRVRALPARNKETEECVHYSPISRSLLRICPT